MSSGQPDWEAFARTMAAVSKSLEHANRILAGQAAMGWAYRGDLAQLRLTLATMMPDQLTELSMAATMLASMADEEMSSR
ncbi:hypothetical protein [Nonomuraea sp. SYSU D8015]|uniref:hypothetical protein n=1 Tax=Nonomuraea sp. SYSU D8015 TaxID=2593644 RepID=UPI001660A71B|nr:hypothetical protein [Nonomuraea sp. SYSU D8015]